MRFILAFALLAAPSLRAYAAAPQGQKLSEIIARIEQTAGVEYVDEVDWSEHGYYEIEYIKKNGAKVEVKIDPRTGDVVK